MDNKNERERDEARRQERIEVEKVKQGQIDNLYAEQKANEKPMPPMSGKQKRKNFWYYYKSTVIVVIAAILIASYFVFDLVTRPKYDTTIVVAVDSSISVYQEQFEKVFEMYATDFDHDNVVNIGAAVLTIIPKDNPTSKNEYAIANKASLLGMLATGERMMYVLDDVAYTHVTDADKLSFEDISKEFPKNKKIKGDRYYIKGTKLEKHLKDLKVELPKNISISIRNFSKYPDELKEKFKTNYDYVKSILSEIIADNK